MIWERICEDLRSAGNVDDLFDTVTHYALRLGFEYCIYSVTIPALTTKSRFHLYNNCPDGWAETYLTELYYEKDPLILKVKQSVSPVIWREEIFSENIKIWQLAQNYGLYTGISMPSWAANDVFGNLSFLRSKDAVTKDEVEELSASLSVIGNYLHHTMYQFLDVENELRIPVVSLTMREREILRWTSEGKTAEVVGAILSISTRTVNFHISNILTKLTAVNKVQAVVKAQSLGLI